MNSSGAVAAWQLRACGGCGWLCLAASLAAAPLSHPEVDNYNVHVGSQTFAPRYQFTTNTALVETAEALRATGSDIIKFAVSKNVAPYGISLSGAVTNLTSLARDEPSFRRVFDGSFRHFLLWTYTFAANNNDTWWRDGYSASERQREYDEIYDFSRYLLTNYNHSGKSFYLGHWEGDWYLLPGYNVNVNPSPTAIQGMIDWINNRQQAVDDALRDTPHDHVAVFNYIEANRVRDAMLNGPTNNQRVINMVVPAITNLDYVSWSSYDGMTLPAGDLWATLNYMEAQMATNKAAAIPGRRVFIGEYGWGGTLSPDAQEPVTRGYLEKLLPWKPPFILFWQMYDNEGKAYCLIDSNNVRTACWHLHHRLINQSRLLTARFLETNRRLPDDAEFSSLVTPILNQPLPAPVRLTVTNGGVTALTVTSATVNGWLTQGVYGDDQAAVGVCWGWQDGGTNRLGWPQSAVVGVNTSFNPAMFTAQLTNLAPRTNYFFRFFATNANSQAWAPVAGQFSTDAVVPEDYGSRMKVRFAGYRRATALTNFPVLVLLGTNLPGFSYRQFASPGGRDLRFTDASGTRPIAHEIDEWNTNGTSIVWVQVPTLSSSNDFIWAYWGNAAATHLPAYATNGAVWSQNFELVWHLKESAFPFADSASKHPAAAGDAPLSTAAGIVGRAGVFNGTADYLNAGAVNLGDRFTLSAWVNLNAAATSIQTVWGNKAGGGSPTGFSWFVNSWNSADKKIIFETANGSWGTAGASDTNLVTYSQWHHLAAVVNRAAGTVRLFLDGVDRTVSETIQSDFANQSAVNLGRFTNSLYYFKGTVDEARIESDLRCPDWVWASWLTVASNATFASYATVSRQSPALSAALSGGQIRLTWPASSAGFALYTSTNVGPTANWLPDTNQSVFLNDLWQVTLTASPNATRFHRLQSQAP